MYHPSPLQTTRYASKSAEREYFTFPEMVPEVANMNDRANALELQHFPHDPHVRIPDAPAVPIQQRDFHDRRQPFVVEMMATSDPRMLLMLHDKS